MVYMVNVGAYLDDQKKHAITRIAVKKDEVKFIKCVFLFICTNEGEGHCDLTYMRLFDLQGLCMHSVNMDASRHEKVTTSASSIAVFHSPRCVRRRDLAANA